MRDDFIDFLRRIHREATTVGWDFSSLDGRLDTDETPWDFDADVRAALSTATDAIDVGTGGGERLITHLEALGDHRPARLRATEGWADNVPVATAALAAWNVPVLEYDPEFGDVFPVDDASVDLLVNRHEAVDVAEFARVLRPGGRLLTQQVDGRDAAELREWFGGEPMYPEVTLDKFVPQFEAAGFRVDVAEEWTGAMRFRDVATLVEYIAKVPWDVEDFTVDEHAEALRALADTRPLVVSQRRFRLHATRLD